MAYQILRWEPGREVRLHRPMASLGVLAWVLPVAVPAVFGIVYLALSVMAPEMAVASRFLSSAGAAGGFAFLALIGVGIVWLVAWASGPRTVVLDWAARRLHVEVRGMRKEHDFSTLRELELRRAEVTGESGPSSYSCALYAQVAGPGGTRRSVEILETDLIDDPDTPYAMTAGLASQLAESLGLPLQVTEKRF